MRNRYAAWPVGAAAQAVTGPGSYARTSPTASQRPNPRTNAAVGTFRDLAAAEAVRCGAAVAANGVRLNVLRQLSHPQYLRGARHLGAEGRPLHINAT